MQRRRRKTQEEAGILQSHQQNIFNSGAILVKPTVSPQGPWDEGLTSPPAHSVMEQVHQHKVFPPGLSRNKAIKVLLFQAVYGKDGGWGDEVSGGVWRRSREAKNKGSVCCRGEGSRRLAGGDDWDVLFEYWGVSVKLFELIN